MFSTCCFQGRRICPPLRNPKYGLIYGGEFWEGKQVSFTCRSGFGLIGPLQRRCLMNGSWTGSQPECNAVSALWKASTIIAGNLYYYSNLHQFLKPAAGSHPQWLLCYRASTHGWSVSTFHNRCDGKPNTVTIVKAGQYVFGGYTDIPWESSGGYTSTPNAFLFSLRNEEGLAPF